jgi:competence protein ComEA
MIWLYRLQQRLSITRHEGLAILTLTLLFITGLTVRHVQEQQVPPVAVDSLVARPAAGAASSGPSTADATPAPNAPSAAAPINVNAAAQPALEALPGIGPALSERIIEYRSNRRPFQRVEELRRVRGIGPKTLADLRPMIRVSASDAP